MVPNNESGISSLAMVLKSSYLNCADAKQAPLQVPLSDVFEHLQSFNPSSIMEPGKDR